MPAVGRSPQGARRPAPTHAMRPALRFLAALGLMLAALPAVRAEEEKILNVLNWSDYIAEDTIRNFERETGIRVHYDNFDSNETLHARLVAGRTGYDIVVPSAPWARLQIEGGLLRKLDKRLLPNLKNLDPEVQALLARLDPGNEYLVDWLWGYTTVGVNVGKVKAALGPLPWPDDAWDLVFKPEYASRLKTCGLSFLDAATEVVPAALHYLGRPAYSAEPADLAAAAALLKTVRPHVTVFSNSGYINDMASGAICAALGWSGDFHIARQRAIEGRTGQVIRALVPRRGGLLLFDVMAIPADAPRPLNAHRFIDYILRPEVHAALTNKVFYANPNLAARPHVRADVAQDASVFLPADDLRRMVPPQAVSNEQRRALTRTFTAFKTGH